MTDAQFEWVKTQEMIQKISPTKRIRRPENIFLAFLYDVVNHTAFETIILITITSNTVVLALNSFGAPDEQVAILEKLNVIFSVIFHK